MAELLFWPALLAYGEAAVAYVGVLRRFEPATRLAIWGVRIGWLVQTALIAAQAVSAEGFAWATWAGALNLFVWLVVGVYLIWGCRPRYHLLGLALMPLAVVLFAVAAVGGGIDLASERDYSTVFLALHVGLVVGAFAAFTVAAALALLYLWQERRLQDRPAGVLRVGAPSLVTLDSLLARTIVVALPVLTVGIAVGVARLRGAASLDAAMAVTLLAWLSYGAFVILRYGAGWRGHRSAQLALGGFALVVAAGVGLPLVHGG